MIDKIINGIDSNEYLLKANIKANGPDNNKTKNIIDTRNARLSIIYFCNSCILLPPQNNPQFYLLSPTL